MKCLTLLKIDIMWLKNVTKKPFASAQKIDVKIDSGWGFCSKDCYPDKEQPMFGLAKEKNIDILKQSQYKNH